MVIDRHIAAAVGGYDLGIAIAIQVGDNDAGPGAADVVGAGIEVPQVVGEVAAGNLDANAVSLAECVAGRPPELDRVRIHFAGFNADFRGVKFDDNSCDQVYTNSSR